MMHLIDIDPVCPQPSKTIFARSFDMDSREARLIRPFAHATVHLGRQHHLVPTASPLCEPTADDLLCPAFTEFPAVHICRIKKIDAEFQGTIHKCETVWLACLRPEIHRAQTES